MVTVSSSNLDYLTALRLLDRIRERLPLCERLHDSLHHHGLGRLGQKGISPGSISDDQNAFLSQTEILTRVKLRAVGVPGAPARAVGNPLFFGGAHPEWLINGSPADPAIGKRPPSFMSGEGPRRDFSATSGDVPPGRTRQPTLDEQARTLFEKHGKHLDEQKLERWGVKPSTLLDEVNYAQSSTFGAISEAMAVQAVVNNASLLANVFGVTDYVSFAEKSWRERRPYKTVELADGFFVAVEEGDPVSEACCGLRVSLYKKTANSSQLLGSVGFQQSDSGIEIVNHQGGQMADRSQRARILKAFKDLSGGVAPLPWLAFVVGDLLAEAAGRQDKPLRFIDGRWLAYGYPHTDEALPVKTIEDAKVYPWKGELTPWLRKKAQEIVKLKARIENLKRKSPIPTNKIKEIEEIEESISQRESAIKFHREGPRVAPLYNDMARDLGFTPAEEDQLWHVYNKNPQEFGRKVRAGSPHPERFEALAAHARSLLKPEGAQGRTGLTLI